MQNLVQRIIQAALLAACVIKSANAAAIAGNPRDVLELELVLTAVQFPSPPRPQGSHWVLSYGDNRVDIGDILRCRLFEDSPADEPIFDFYYDGTHTGHGILGFFGPSEHFQDLQGLLLIELYEGSVSIDRIFAETYLSGERYMDSRSLDVTLVPEPSVGILLSIGIGFLLFRRPRGMVNRPIVAGQ